MEKSTFLDYLATYNSGDVDGTLSYYAEDIVFENFGRRQCGVAVGEFLRGLHHAVTTRMVPRVIALDGDTIALEADAEITALIDLPELPTGAMVKGETGHVRMFMFYRTSGNRILHIRIAGWPLVRAG